MPPPSSVMSFDDMLRAVKLRYPSAPQNAAKGGGNGAGGAATTAPPVKPVPGPGASTPIAPPPGPGGGRTSTGGGGAGTVNVGVGLTHPGPFASAVAPISIALAPGSAPEETKGVIVGTNPGGLVHVGTGYLPGGTCCAPGVQPMMLHIKTPMSVPSMVALDERRDPPMLPLAVRGLTAALLGAQVPSALVGQRAASPPSPLVPALTLVATSLGASQGEAFALQILNGGLDPVRLAAGQLVVQPLKKEAQAEARKLIQQMLPKFKNPVAARIEGYCLAYGLAPPSPGTLFQIASPEIQQRFAGAGSVLRSAERLQRLGLLKPDSNPKAYFESIKQYAVWTKLESWDMRRFAETLLDKTRANIAGAKQRWTTSLEQQLMSAVPGRWRDVQQVLRGAVMEAVETDSGTR
ncbi:MAG: hypothetical protein IT176_10565 [Acidobacteria bacterium]|nr:hypothetical protein [Acidobacteriota bacterium]